MFVRLEATLRAQIRAFEPVIGLCTLLSVEIREVEEILVFLCPGVAEAMLVMS